MKTKNKKLFGVCGVSAHRVILQRVWLGRDLSKWPCVAGASPSQIKKRHIGLFSIRFLWQICKYFDRCEEKSSQELVSVRMWTRYDQYLVYCLNVPFAGHLCPTGWVNSRSLTSPVDHERRTCIELRVSEREMFSCDSLWGATLGCPRSLMMDVLTGAASAILSTVKRHLSSSDDPGGQKRDVLSSWSLTFSEQSLDFQPWHVTCKLSVQVTMKSVVQNSKLSLLPTGFHKSDLSQKIFLSCYIKKKINQLVVPK